MSTACSSAVLLKIELFFEQITTLTATLNNALDVYDKLDCLDNIDGESSSVINVAALYPSILVPFRHKVSLSSIRTAPPLHLFVRCIECSCRA